MSHVNKVHIIIVKMICVAVIRAFQPIVVQKMWMLAVALTTYVSFCIVSVFSIPLLFNVIDA
jgi:hypothetical protein